MSLKKILPLESKKTKKFVIKITIDSDIYFYCYLSQNRDYKSIYEFK
jgi:hypothetical protein